MIEPDAIHALYLSRRNKNAKVLNAGQVIRNIYNGDHTIPLPELERTEKAAVFNMVQMGIDQHAQRITSTWPDIRFPPVKNTISSRQLAVDRRSLSSRQDANKYQLKQRTRARYLIAYASAPCYLRPGSEKEGGIPIWEVMDPLATFPAPMPMGQMVPSDCIFAFRRSWTYLNQTYNIQAKIPLSKDQTVDTMLTVLLHMDDEYMTMIAVGNEPEANDMPGFMNDTPGKIPVILLQRVPNLAQGPVAFVPGRI